MMRAPLQNLALLLALGGCAGGTRPSAPGGSGGAIGEDTGGTVGAAAPIDAAAGGRAGAPTDATPRDPGAPDSAGADAPSPNEDGPGPAASTQGPTAEGQIVYSQDFENGHEGITFSPTNLPESRAMIVDDPLGQRGKVMRMQWLPGDNYRIGQYHPRANISNTGFHYESGDRISYAWGYMTESDYIGATIAQNISGGDPIWMLRGRAGGELDVIPIGNGLLSFKMQAKKWHDVRAEVNYLPGAAGSVEIFIDGQMVFSRHGGLDVGPRAHWDGGIYLTSFGLQGDGPRTARTVYISNLSVGKK
jgi:hypothetical protein